MLFVATCGLAITGGVLPADEIVRGQTTLEKIRIVDVDGARVVYRTPGGSLDAVDVTEVERLYVDSVEGLSALNEAESLAARGDPTRAISSYERALRMTNGFWVPLVQARMIRAGVAAGRIDTVAAQFIALVRAAPMEPVLAAELVPAGPLEDNSPRTPQVIRQLNASIDQAQSQSARILLEMMRFVITEGVDPDRAKAYARELAWQPIPPVVGSRAAYRVKAKALRSLLAEGKRTKVLQEIDAVMLDAPYPVLPELLLVKAEGLEGAAKSKDDLIRAAWAAMRVVVHYPDDERTPEALAMAAGIEARLGRAPSALQLFQECLEHQATTTQLGEQVRAEMERLRSSG